MNELIVNSHIVVPSSARHRGCTYQHYLIGNVTTVPHEGIRLSFYMVGPGVPLLPCGTIDNVTLTYDGNQLKTANDTRPTLTYEGAMDFRDVADETTEYHGTERVCHNVRMCDGL